MHVWSKCRIHYGNATPTILLYQRTNLSREFVPYHTCRNTIKAFNNGFINRVLILVLQMQPIHPAPHPRFNSLPRLRRRIHRRNRHHPSPPPTHRRPSHPSPYRRRPLSLQSSHHPPRCHYRLSIRELRALLRRRCSVGSQAFAH